MSILKELKVLYVEDDDNLSESLGRFLKRRFGRVFLADCAERGIEIFEEQSPDIAIIDIILPGMSGLEMIKILRERKANCKILITSTVNDVATIISAIDLDIESYVVKPIDTEELEEKLIKIGHTINEERHEEGRVKSFELDGKKEIEESIRKGVLKIFKTKSGKGPRDAVVFISGNTIEITSFGTLGPFEKHLITDIKNIGYVEEGRRLFYRLIERDLIELIDIETGAKVEVKRVDVNAAKDKERITLICI